MIYSSHPPEILNPILKEFQERTGIGVEVITAGTGELLRRIQDERLKPQGDLIWGGGAELLEAYKIYFTRFKTSQDQNIANQYKDQEYLWTGFTALPMVLMYNKKLVKLEETPASWSDLLDPKWKGRIACADPIKSGSAYTIIMTLLTVYGRDPKGWHFIEQLVKNIDGKILPNSAAVYKGVADGEFAIGMTYEAAAVRYNKTGTETGMVYPREGTVVVPDGMAIIKGAKNSANARKFINFAAGRDVQLILAKTLNRRSVRDDVPAPVGLKDFARIKMLNYNIPWAAAHKDIILFKWKQIVMAH